MVDPGIRRKFREHAGDRFGIRARCGDPFLRLADPAGRDQLLGFGDLPGGGHRADLPPQCLEIPGHRYSSLPNISLNCSHRSGQQVDRCVGNVALCCDRLDHAAPRVPEE